jgi:hypothetical protein
MVSPAALDASLAAFLIACHPILPRRGSETRAHSSIAAKLLLVTSNHKLLRLRCHAFALAPEP